MYKSSSILTLLLLAAGLGTGLTAYAQLSAPQDLQAQLARQDEQMIQAGWQVMHLVDTGQFASIWDDASLAMKMQISRDAFISELSGERTRLGAVLERSRPEVTRSHSDGSGGVPAGFYINVISNTRFLNHPESVSELVSFRYDEDEAWRITGYSLH